MVHYSDKFVILGYNYLIILLIQFFDSLLQPVEFCLVKRVNDQHIIKRIQEEDYDIQDSRRRHD